MLFRSSSMRWLTSSVVHNDPCGMSPDMSMTPAPLTPTIPEHAPHSWADDQPSPPADNAAMTRCSRSPGIQQHDPEPRPGPWRTVREIGQSHLPPPYQRRKASAGTGLNAVPGRATWPVSCTGYAPRSPDESRRGKADRRQSGHIICLRDGPAAMRVAHFGPPQTHMQAGGGTCLASSSLDKITDLVD